MSAPKSFDVAIDEFKKVHNDKYWYLFNYSKRNRKYFVILCPEHGLFEQSYSAHKRGSGCPKCNKAHKKTFQEWEEEFKRVHGNKYVYLWFYRNKGHCRVKILCPKHKYVFEQACNDHKQGHGCIKCANKYKRSLYEIEELGNNKYNFNYWVLGDYHKNSKRYIYVLCPNHGIFDKASSEYLRGSGCPSCVDFSDILKYSKDDWQNKYNSLYGNGNYIVLEVLPRDKYTQSRLSIKCEKHNIIFEQIGSSFLSGRNGCYKCKPKSLKQNEIADFLKSLNVDIEINNRKILNGLEIDIYLPEYNLGIEFNGLLWHSELYRKNDLYHIENKRKLAETIGIQLINIYEDDWLYKQDIVKSILLHRLGFNKNKVFARQCKIVDLTSKQYSKFNIENHIMGNRQAKYKIGLVYDDELVAVAGFSDTELLRYTVKKYTNIVGGLGKIVKWFTENVSNKLFTYVDLDYFSGNGYKKIGFVQDIVTQPKYWYFSKKEYYRQSRQKFQKHKLKKLFDNYDNSLTEYEICNMNGYYRIFGCSNLRLVHNS